MTRYDKLHRWTAALALTLFAAACQDAELLTGPAPTEPAAAVAGAQNAPFVGGSVAAGERHGCALTKDGTAFCWGANDLGQLGDGTTTPSATPVAVAGGLRFTALSSAGNHTCGLARDGTAHCWGQNGSGQLGNGTTTASSTPVAVVGGRAFANIGAGWGHTCAVDAAGAAYCWGANGAGQLSASSSESCAMVAGDSSCSTAPLPAAAGMRFASLSVGMSHNCGIATDGVAYCWGWNAFGQLGDGTWRNRSEPTPIAGGIRFAAITSGAAHSCGLDTSGAARCWGGNYGGGLGDGTTTLRLAPVAVRGGLRFAGIAASTGNNIFGHTCAVTAAGDAYCWGGNDRGQLGGPSSERCLLGRFDYACSTAPVEVTGGESFAALELGNEFTCGESDRAGQLFCWGSNAQGQLGSGGAEESGTPVPLAGPKRGRTPPRGPSAIPPAGMRVVEAA